MKNLFSYPARLGQPPVLAGKCMYLFYESSVICQPTKFHSNEAHHHITKECSDIVSVWHFNITVIWFNRHLWHTGPMAFWRDPLEACDTLNRSPSSGYHTTDVSGWRSNINSVWKHLLFWIFLSSALWNQTCEKLIQLEVYNVPLDFWLRAKMLLNHCR